MLCKGCGKEIENDASYCTYCGLKVEPEARRSEVKAQQETDGQTSMTQQKTDRADNTPPQQSFNNSGDIPPRQGYNEWGNIPPQQGFSQTGNVPPQQGYSGPGSIPPQQGFNQTGNVPPRQGYNGPGSIPPQQGFNRTGDVPPRQGYNGPGNIPPQQGFNRQGNLPPQGTNMMPPNGYMPNTGKKKSKIVIPIIAGTALLLVVLLLIIFIPKIIHKIIAKEVISEEINDLSGPDDITPIPSPSPTPEDIVINEPTEALVDPMNDVTYVECYSYSELPEVSSLDSFSNFIYFDCYGDSGATIYQFEFSGDKAGDEFNATLDQYGSILEDTYGYTYEQETDEEDLTRIGDYTAYYIGDGIGILITEDRETHNGALVSIMPIVATGGNDSINAAYPYYYSYIDGRDTTEIDFGIDYQMENTMSFHVRAAYSDQLNDGVSIEMGVRLAAQTDGWYMVPQDFLIIPYDSDGNILGDATVVSAITDIGGNDVSMPTKLSVDYTEYLLTFYAPAGTTYVGFYATNLLDDGLAGPLYAMDITFE
mgnify:CR=1 FL=1